MSVETVDPTAPDERPLRVCIDARLVSGTSGGVESFAIGLASGLSLLPDGDEEYLFLAYADADEWIRPYVHGRCRMLPDSAGAGWLRLRRRISRGLPGSRGAMHLLRRFDRRRSVRLPRSSGVIERAGAHLVHFVKQDAFLTCVPSIYHPWDLQHLHLPDFFTPRARLVRELTYRAYCRQAGMVSTASSWGKRDLMHHYALPDEKVQIVPVAPPASAYAPPTREDLEAVRRKFALPEAFAFYPAQTWPHKNHLGLLEALGILRDRHGRRVPLVCSGRLTEFYSELDKRVRRLRLADQVQFLGFVSPVELRCLYELCRCLVFPSKFEGGGLPLYEAFAAGAPAACSNATLLPDLAGDAALIFDPDAPACLAEAIGRLWTDPALRATLAARGRARVANLSWERTACIFRAHYRRLAQRRLTDEDRALLAAPAWL